MQALQFPDILYNNKTEIPDLLFVDYKAQKESEKNKVIFKKNIFNFINNGHKIIETIDGACKLDSSNIIIIKSGNCLTTEKFSNNLPFNSLSLFFDNKCVQEFLIKYDAVIRNSHSNSRICKSGTYVSIKDDFINNYIESVYQFIKNHKQSVLEYTRLKFEEIMLYLVQKLGVSFSTFLKNLVNDPLEIDFKATIEAESLNTLTLEEIAFLCNMSLSTFKRHFAKSFGASPQKWFQQKRMQYAYESIKSKVKTPSDLYLELGYNSLSSFSVAFSKTFGIPPTKINEIIN